MKLIKKIAKKVLPQVFKNKIKVMISKYPYIFHLTFLMNKKKNIQILNEIISKKSKGTIVFPPTVDWHMPLFQRPQQLALAFSKIGYTVFYATNNLRFDKVNGFEKVADNLYLTNQMHLLRNLEDIFLLISWPFNRFYLERFPRAKFIYDYIDELDVFDTSGRSRKELLQDHEYLTKNADLVVATADKLLSSVLKLGPKKAILVPNGVNLADFRSDLKFSVPEDMCAIVSKKHKIIGYYGAIAEWFDYDLLEQAAGSRPDLEFVLIGPFDYDKTLMAHKHLFERSNIHFLGAKKYADLAKYLYYFDVATIPFLVNEITRATSPVKLFEYMAGGKPIVTTNMDECKKYKSVLVAQSKEDFILKLNLALEKANDTKYKKQLSQDARENTWGKRAEIIISSLE